MPGSGADRHLTHIYYQGALSILEKANCQPKEGKVQGIDREVRRSFTGKANHCVCSIKAHFSDLRIHPFIHSNTQQILSFCYPPGVVLGLIFFFCLLNWHIACLLFFFSHPNQVPVGHRLCLPINKILNIYCSLFAETI